LEKENVYRVFIPMSLGTPGEGEALEKKKNTKTDAANIVKNAIIQRTKKKGGIRIKKREKGKNWERFIPQSVNRYTNRPGKPRNGG